MVRTNNNNKVLKCEAKNKAKQTTTTQKRKPTMVFETFVTYMPYKKLDGILQVMI